MLLLCAAVPAQAAPDARAPGSPLEFGRIDSDHNGYVSRVEARTVVAAERFDAADENRDGLLDDEEYAVLFGVRQTGEDTDR
jgi:hypothetical protein